MKVKGKKIINFLLLIVALFMLLPNVVEARGGHGGGHGGGHARSGGSRSGGSRSGGSRSGGGFWRWI